jgi:energy-coupling factor transport system permease protein
MKDAFSKCHPAVNFLFFAGAIGTSVLIQHPMYLLVGILTGATYYLLLNGRKGWKMLLGMAMLFLFLMAINPLFNTFGETPLCYLFGRPYTIEALRYGAVLGGVFVTMLIWFGCYNKVLTSDKFTSLFGNLIPAISLVLVMVFRMVPNLMRKAGQLTGARKSIGKGAGENSTNKEKLNDGMTVLGALTSWALEGSVVTGDSMRSRGYGTAKRTSFMIYQMGIADWFLLILIPTLMALVIIAACFGQMAATFTPDFHLAPLSWGIIPYALYLLIPTVLHTKEAIQWHISKSKI